jgi:hypothetical protein
MDYTHLGRTGLLVSRLCLGTMNFGPETSEEDSYAIMDRALDEGVNFFDTANTYGWRKGEGVTEQIVGRWFDQGGGRREKVVLATKVYGAMGDWPNERKLSALNIRRACEGSLRRLRTDHIDLYQMHHVDRDTPWDELWQAMDVLVQQGKVLYVGSSNFAGWHITQAIEAAGTAPPAGRGVRGVLRRARRAPLGGGAGVAAAPAGGDRADRGAAHHGAVRAVAADAGAHPRRQGAGAPRSDLAGPRRPGPRGVRVVTR